MFEWIERLALIYLPGRMAKEIQTLRSKREYLVFDDLQRQYEVDRRFKVDAFRSIMRRLAEYRKHMSLELRREFNWEVAQSLEIIMMEPNWELHETLLREYVEELLMEETDEELATTLIDLTKSLFEKKVAYYDGAESAFRILCQGKVSAHVDSGELAQLASRSHRFRGSYAVYLRNHNNTEKLVEDLLRPADASTEVAAAETLVGEDSWKPATEQEQFFFYLIHGQFDRAARFGAKSREWLANAKSRFMKLKAIEVHGRIGVANDDLLIELCKELLTEYWFKNERKTTQKILLLLTATATPGARQQFERIARNNLNLMSSEADVIRRYFQVWQSIELFIKPFRAKSNTSDRYYASICINHFLSDCIKQVRRGLEVSLPENELRGILSIELEHDPERSLMRLVEEIQKQARWMLEAQKKPQK